MAETKITINSNGSIRLEGEFALYDKEGNKFDLDGRTKIGLCRCTHSQNQPFCDGSHRDAGFQSEIKARTLPPQPEKI
jgi:CDGSH-type Zn-finger protein